MPTFENDMTEKQLKMYVLVKESIPIGLGVNSVGHTALATYLRFKDDPETRAWVTSRHFKKVTCVVSDEEFERAKSFEDAIGDAEVALGFRPRERWPGFFRTLRLFGSHLKRLEGDVI